MRKESSNQFTEGLICDLNPISTPNTVLTDALNATIITYDGNEHSLQNDRGNYQLKNCRLKPNYIPVGLKEYGDILYIVSYNPLDDTVEIGSYPSPMNVESSNDVNPTNEEFEIDSLIESFTGRINYSDLIKRSKLKIYTGGDEQRYKMYPGDEYRITAEPASEYRYESLEYFVIDDNRKRYDVSHLIEPDGNWHNIPWQVPGWLATQYRLGNFEDFNMSIRSLRTPAITETEIFDCDASLHFQFKISDKLFLPKGVGEEKIESENQIKSDLFIKLVIKKGVVTIQENDIPLTLDGKFAEWYLDSKILWTKFDTTIKSLSKNDNVIIEAIPYLKIITNGEQRIINYDNLIESFSFTLNNIGSYKDFKIAENLWKFYAEPKSNKNEDVLYMEFDVTGPNVTSDAVNLYYRLWNLNTKYNDIMGWEEVNGYNGISDQVTSWINFNDKFQRESMYIIEFAFAPTVNTISEKFTHKKLLITSSIFGDLIGLHNNFEDITFDEWAIKGFKESLKINRVEFDYKFTEQSNAKVSVDHYWDLNGGYLKNDNGIVFENQILNNIWSKNSVSDKGWVKSIDSDYYVKKGIDVNFSKPYDVVIASEFKNINVLNGKLWEDLPGITLELVDKLGNVVDSSTIERDEISGYTKVQTATTQRTKTKRYETILGSDIFRNVANIESIRSIPTMLVTLESIKSNANNMLQVKLYNDGIINLNDDFTDYTWNKNHEWIGTETIGEENIGISNAIARGIHSVLGTNQFGILGVVTHENAYNNEGKFYIYHGTEEIDEFVKDETDLYTYLVFRKNTNSNYAVMVPLTNNSRLWDVKYSTTETFYRLSWHNAKSVNEDAPFKSILTDWLKTFAKDIRLCTAENSLSAYRLIKIDSGKTSIKNADTYKLNISIDGTNSWIYNGYNLLNLQSREKLISDIGENICGSLLTSNITSVNHVDVKTYTIEDDSELSKDFDAKISDFDKSIERINGLISEPDTSDNSELISQIDSRTRHKGVYSLSNDNKSLIAELDKYYPTNGTTYITLNDTGAQSFYFRIKEHKHSMEIGKVSSTVKVS